MFVDSRKALLPEAWQHIAYRAAECFCLLPSAYVCTTPLRSAPLPPQGHDLHQSPLRNRIPPQLRTHIIFPLPSPSPRSAYMNTIVHASTNPGNSSTWHIRRLSPDAPCSPPAAGRSKTEYPELKKGVTHISFPEYIPQRRRNETHIHETDPGGSRCQAEVAPAVFV